MPAFWTPEAIAERNVSERATVERLRALAAGPEFLNVAHAVGAVTGPASGPLVTDRRSEQTALGVFRLLGEHPRGGDDTRPPSFAPIFTADRLPPGLEQARAECLGALEVGVRALMVRPSDATDDQIAALIQASFGMDAASVVVRGAMLGRQPAPLDPTEVTIGMDLPQIPHWQELLMLGLAHALVGLRKHGDATAAYDRWVAACTSTADGIADLDPHAGCAATHVRVLGGPFPVSDHNPNPLGRPAERRRPDGRGARLGPIRPVVQQPADWLVVFPTLGAGCVEVEVINWRTDEIEVVAPADVGPGCVGFVHTPGPRPPAAASSGIEEGAELQGVLAELFGAAGYEVGERLAAGARRPADGAGLPQPACLPADGGSTRPPNHFRGGPPRVRSFRANGVTHATITASAAVTLTWDVDSADVVRVVARAIDERPHDLPPVSVAQGASGAGPFTLTLLGVDDWEGAYELMAYNQCAGLNADGSLDDTKAVRAKVTIELRERAPLYGFADTHAHFASHVGFGGIVIWGKPIPPDPALTGDPGVQAALGQCHPLHGPGGTHINFEGGTILGGHLVGGHPLFDGWPKNTTVAHQQAYVDWIRRAVDGGLRLVVSLAVNNELAANRIESRRPPNGPPLLPYDDRTTVVLQVNAMRAMVQFVADQAALTGEAPWMEIAATPADARRIVAAGHLAIVPGVEVDSLGGWKTEAQLDAESGGDPDVARSLIAAYLDELELLGVRHVFPVHLCDNAFGGPALYNVTFDAINLFNTKHQFSVESGDQYGISYRLDQDTFAGGAGGAAIAYFDRGVKPGPDFLPTFALIRNSQWEATKGGHINSRGLSEIYGPMLIKELMRRGMIIDIDHMGAKTTDAVLTLAEEHHYPVVCGHTGFRELQYGNRLTSTVDLPESFDRSSNADNFGTSIAGHLCHEGNKSPEVLERVRKLQGLVSVILHQGDIQNCQYAVGIANDSPGSSKSFAHALLYAIHAMNGRRIAFGSDIDGGVQQPGPRFGPRASEILAEDEVRKHLRRWQLASQTDGVKYSGHILEYRDSRFQTPKDDYLTEDERDVWEAIALHESGVDPALAHKPPPFRNVGRIANIARGLGYSLRSQVQDPPLGGDTMAEQLAGYLVATSQLPGPGDPPRAAALFYVISGMKKLWENMSGTNQPLTRSTAGTRDFDLNLDGMAHYGLLPDFMQDLRNIGVKPRDMAVLERSAEDYIRVWELSVARRLP